jgi:two-component system LytT family response regulator
MLNTFLFDPEGTASNKLEHFLFQYCPGVSFYGKVSCIENLESTMDTINADLVFVEINPSSYSTKCLVSLAKKQLEYVVISECIELAYEAFKFNATDFILKPIEANELACTIQNVINRKKIKNDKELEKQVIYNLHQKLAGDSLIGIPTIDGFDFIKIGDILRCEGLQRCTRVVNLRGESLISSYNLGEFCRLLEPYGFFSPHRSHLINLNYIKEYKKEGTIVLHDGSSVPTSRRRKAEFLTRIVHL